MGIQDLNNDIKSISKYKVKNCLQCGAKTNNNDDRELFCSECGAPVLNKCSNYDCQEVLEETAKYCKYCGSSSIFKNYGLFDKTTTSPNYIDDLPF